MEVLLIYLGWQIYARGPQQRRDSRRAAGLQMRGGFLAGRA
jgi:hypothetical protein